ncbi:IS3 family transposase [Pseudomonas oryzihabitans]|uniref:IS3 family transposase n=1 Tax=Pseudomonas oryzihabitans TaxID=47885 RepID=UPI0011A31BC7|nr:IS3 family transposase [Pseudomonas psychrotolerans]
MPKYPLPFKMKIVAQYQRGDCTYGQLAREHRVSVVQVKEWIGTYARHGKAGLQKRYRYHSVDFKIEVVRQIAEGLSIRRASERFNLNRSQMQRWVNAWQQYGIEGLASKRRGDALPHPTVPNPSAFKSHSASPVRELEKQVAYLQVKNVFLRKAMSLGLKDSDLDNRQKALIVQELRSRYPLDALLQGAGLPRSSFYYHLNVARQPDKQGARKESIRAMFTRHRGRYGYRRITQALRNEGQQINHKAVQRLMGEMSLKCTSRRRRYRPFTGPESYVAPNLLERRFTAPQPNQRWATDITEFRVNQNRLYLSPILDLFNREIVAYEISERATFTMVLRMLKGGLKTLRPDEKPLIHSDQGWHYQYPAYQQTIRQHGITQSMSRRGNCLDNAAMESFFAVLKSELFHCAKFATVEQLAAAIREYIHYYNHERIKLLLGSRSPVGYRMAKAAARGGGS